MLKTTKDIDWNKELEHKTYKDYLNRQDPVNELYEDLLEFVYPSDVFDESKFEQLTPQSQAFYLVNDLYGRVYNSCFYLYLESTSAQKVFMVINALEEVKAKMAVFLLNGLLKALFGYVPEKSDDSSSLLHIAEHYDTGEFDATCSEFHAMFLDYLDTLDKRLLAYLNEHQDVNLLV